MKVSDNQLAEGVVQRPTDAELNILSVIWRFEKVTVRQVFNELSTTQDIGYSTVLKLMQIMLQKGILAKDDSCRPQVFWAVASQQQTQHGLLDHLKQKAVVGSTASLVLSALSSQDTTADELKEIKEMIAEMEGQQDD